ncbi:MAG TPA: recombinase family protein [Rhodanobacter sp.]|nr:recombinase family protein [Rhodanobacter sp.]
MLIGYARVSTLDQELAMQVDALEASGCERIFTDKASGATQDRAGLADALAFARPGDCLVVWKLDRLGRSVKGLVDMAAQLAERKVDLRSLTDGIDTKGAAGRFFFHVMAALAEMERELIRERTLAGLDAAKRAGKIGGRKRAMTPAKIDAAQRLLDGGMLAKDVASTVGVSVPTFYRYFPASERADA